MDGGAGSNCARSPAGPGRTRAGNVVAAPLARKHPALPRSARLVSALRVPGVRLFPPLLQPEVQRVVDDEAVPELLMVVLEQAREPQRDGQETGALRREVEAGGVCTAHDDREVLED